MKAIQDIIRALREDCDLNQTQVAEIIGTTQQYYSKYENGEHEIPLRVAIALADYYNVSLDYITGRARIWENVDVLNIEFVKGYSCSALLSDLLKLSKEKRIALKHYVDFLTSEGQ